MTFVWDKTDDRIWFGKWAGDDAPFKLRLIVERLPGAKGSWDWTVWETEGLRMVRRGVEETAMESALSAETAAIYWPRTRRDT